MSLRLCASGSEGAGGVLHAVTWFLLFLGNAGVLEYWSGAGDETVLGLLLSQAAPYHPKLWLSCLLSACCLALSLVSEFCRPQHLFHIWQGQDLRFS